jgi:hypothetical protein
MISQVEKGFMEEWIAEIEAEIEGEIQENEEGAWDDVHGGTLPLQDVEAARREEVGYMGERKIWSLRPVKECWEKTGKPPVSVRWVDTNKGGSGEMIVRLCLIARDFKGGDKDRDDLFAARLRSILFASKGGVSANKSSRSLSPPLKSRAIKHNRTIISPDPPLLVSTHLTDTGGFPVFSQHSFTGRRLHIFLSPI